MHTEGCGRYGAEIETAAYFCCLEATQTAGKHAGPDARIDPTIAEHDDVLEFAAADTGTGVDPAAIVDRHGLVNMRDRLAGFAGRLDIDAAPGRGAMVRGRESLS